MKTELLDSGEDGKKSIRITAKGFGSRDRTDYVDVLGGDGFTHSVPVPWVLYLPVEKKTALKITELPDKDNEVFRQENYPVEMFRRKILIEE